MGDVVNDQRPAVDRSGLRALWLGLGALVLTLFFAPLGLVAGIAAVVIGIKARKPGVKVPGAVPGIVMGLIGALFSTVTLALTVYLWPDLSGYQKCLSTANTNTDEQVCKDTWLPKMEDRLNLPAGSFEPYEDLF